MTKAFWWLCVFNPYWWAELRRKRRLEKQRVAEEILGRLQSARELEARKRQLQHIRRYPVRNMTAEELEELRKAPDIDFATCPFGSWFVCKPSDLVPDMVVVGQVVRGNDAFADQWGAGLSVPERFVNRYQVKITEKLVAAQ